MLQLLVPLSLILAFASGQFNRCPTGWEPYKGYCYYFTSTTWNWKEAQRNCADRQGTLVSIATAAEATFVSKLVKAKRQHYWIGLTDTAKEGTFVWLDPKVKYDFKKLPWFQGEPNNHGGNEDCAAVTKNGLLNDANCNTRFRSVCKRNLFVADKCDLANGWQPLGTKCFKYFDIASTWNDAKANCQNQNGNLLIVNDVTKQRFIQESITCKDVRSNAWIGLSDKADKKNFKWDADGTAVDAKLASWDKGMPKASSKPGDNCAVVLADNNFKWSIQSCNEEHKYICERPQGKCPSGWRMWYGICYQTVAGRKTATWTDAVKYCNSQGATLLTQDLNGEKNYLVKTLLPALKTARVQEIWIGISDQATDGTFLKWDGTPVTVKNWDKNQPRNLKNRMDCARVSTSSKTAAMSTDNCFYKRAFVCEMPMHAQLVPPTTPPPPRYYCDKGWKVFNGSCYLFNLQETTFDAANPECINQNAKLASITSADEQSFISANMKAISWFGLNDKAINNKFTFVDGTPFETTSFKNWNVNEPNGGTREQCVAMFGPGRNVGGWIDLPCNQRRDYICKKDAIDGTLPTTAPPTTRPWSPLCGPYWVYDPTNDHCYLISDDFKTWDEARSSCSAQGAGLLCITTPHEQSFMTGLMMSYAQTGGNFWIGGNDRSAEGGWSWSDDSPFRYLNWYPGEPNAWGGGEDCVEMSPSRNGKWNDAKCNSKYRYICEKATNAPTPPTDPFATSSTPIDCTPSEMISGTHWLPDKAITASSVWNDKHGPMNSRLDWTSAARVTVVNTKNEYKYQPIKNLDLRGATFVRLQVKACNDAHINLMADTTSSTDRKTYEIVIGGWGNTKSIIRENAQTAEKVSANTKDILNCGSFRQFWISWDGAYFKVGTGNNVNDDNAVIMKWQDPTPYAVGGISVSTGYGATGQWKVFSPYGGRSAAWCAKVNKKGEWIQADFSVPIVVKGIVTQGRADWKQWVITYVIQYKYDTASKWITYTDPVGKTKIFNGNKDQTTKVQNDLTFPFEAQFVRVVPQTWLGHISMRWEVLGCIADSECMGEYLVTGDARVADTALTASSTWSNNLKPARARLDLTGGAWVAASVDDKQWIQVDLGQDFRVRGVVTQGNPASPQWVTSYKVSYRGATDKDITFYQEPYGTVKAFIGNKDQNTKVSNMFASPFTARYLRINPMTSYQHIAMRFDVVGCQVGCEAVALIDGPHKVHDNQLRACSQYSGFLNPTRSRLNTKKQGNLRGGWKPKTNQKGHWIQVDLEVAMYIRAIATQGRSDYDGWVKSYFVTYSTDRKKWYSYQENKKRKIFNGNWDRNTIRKNFLLRPFTARYIRVWPQTWNKEVSLRWEVYGCQSPQATAASTLIGCFEDNKQMRDLPFAPWMPAWGMWLQSCVRHCFHYGYMFAGLQGGKYCYCGNTYGSHGPSGRCKTKCTGNPNTICGGSYANSVYSTGIGPKSVRCEDGWTPSGDSCYKLVQDSTQTWLDSRDNCRSLGGDLASINTAIEHSAVTSVIAPVKGATWTGVWIGLNDLDHQMYFSWSDGSIVALTKWNRNEPNNWRGKNEDCVQIFKGNGLWNDEKCDRLLPSVCEKPKQVLPPSTVPPTLWGCDQGWSRYSYSCYLFSSSYPRNWYAARAFCRQMGAQLVRVNDVYEQAFLSSQLGTARGLYWTDLTDKILKGTYSWSDRNSAVMQFTNWDKSQPNDKVGQCVTMNAGLRAGLWSDRNCGSKYNLVCEKMRKGFTSPPPPTHPLTPPPCADGWYGWGDNCFQFNIPTTSNLQRSWVGARADCIAKGGELASFHNDTEMTDIYMDNLQSLQTANFWIGLNQRDPDKGYIWSDGSGVTYTNWNDNEPNDHQGQEDCAELYPASGRWNDANCGINRNWICSIPRTKTPSNIATTPAPTPGPAGSCSPDDDTWKFYKGKCYFFSDGQNDMSMTWRRANNYCMSKGGYLASILDQDTQNFIYGQAVPLNIQWMWIGLNELTVNDGHSWADGSPATYFNWASEEPNDWGGGESCVSMILNKGGQWNDEHCTVNAGFVCEKFKGANRITPPTIPLTLPGFCPVGYLTFNNKCFKIFGKWSDRMNWTAARDTCRANGDELATVQSTDENAFLTSNFLGAQDSLWIGLNKMTRGQFHWDNEDEVTYANWDQGEPNGNRKNPEPCVEILTTAGNHHAGHWNDLPCDWSKGYICMRQRQINILTPGPTINTCGVGWAPLGQACYLYSSSSSSWDQAKANCEQNGATLATISSEIEQAFLYTMLKPKSLTMPIWIGLSDKLSPGSYNWVDSWPVIYTNWGNNEPSTGSGEGCVSFNTTDGTWKDGVCTQQLASVCRKLPAGVTPPFTQPPPNGQCPQSNNEQWVPFKNQCYLFKIQEEVSFADASMACNTRYGETVSIHSAEEGVFLQQHMSSMSWKSAWTSLLKSQNGGFFWKDRTPVQYTKWADGEPNDHGDNSEGCVQLYSSGFWNDLDCAAKLGYICKTKMSYGSDLTTPPDIGEPSVSPGGVSSSDAPPPVTPSTPYTGGKPDGGRQHSGGSVETPTKPQSSTPTGAIIGVVVGTLIVIALVAFGVYFYRNKYRPGKDSSTGFDNALYSSSQDAVKVHSSVDFDATNIQTDA